MTLEQLITAITQAKIIITILDSNDVELIKFYTGGQNYLATDLLSRQVANIKIENQTTIVVELKDAVNSEP
jgi:hypothetical protein